MYRTGLIKTIRHDGGARYWSNIVCAAYSVAKLAGYDDHTREINNGDICIETPALARLGILDCQMILSDYERELKTLSRPKFGEPDRRYDTAAEIVTKHWMQKRAA